MSETEFPAELVKRCAKAAAKVWTSENKNTDLAQAATLFEPTALAVLREAMPGYADLVAALKEADADLKRHVGATHWRTPKELFARIDAALKAAGRK